MAIAAVLSAIINYFVTSAQQDDEFFEQQKLLRQQQDYQTEREEWYFEHNNIGAQFQQMTDAGFNPNLAANALLGGSDVSAAQSGSSPSAPTVNSSIGALQSMFGQGGQNLYDLLKNQAEIENIQANTDKQTVETGIMPRDFQLRQLTAIEQFKVWDASVERSKAAQHLDEEQTRLVRQQNLYYGRMAEAEINSYIAKVNESYKHAQLMLEQIETEDAKQRELNTQSVLNVANANLANANAGLVEQETKTEKYNTQRQKIAFQFENELGGIPLTADAQKYVQSLAKRGDVDGIRNFYLTIFGTAQNQSLGEQLGGMHSHWQLPFGLFSKDYPNPALKAYGSAPVWNMYK